MCFGCCAWCCRGLLLLLPVLVAWFCTGFDEGKESLRKIGTTEFAKAELYEVYTLTEEHRTEFFRDGATLLKGVLKLEVVRKLRAVAEASQEGGNLTTASNLWMEYDEFLDFYIFGPLGNIAAQIFRSPEAVTSDLPAAAYLQRDFVSTRHHNRTNGWHMDRTECQGGDQPAKFTSTALARLAILLEDVGSRGAMILNQSRYAAALPRADAERYWQGSLPYRREGRFEAQFGQDTNLTVPVLPGITITEDMIMEHWVEPGDVVIFNTCLWHRSPPWAGLQKELGLQPTFAPATHVPKDPPTVMDMGGSWCAAGLGRKQVSDGSTCHPQVYPEALRPAKGSTLRVRRNPTPKIRHVLASYLGLRISDKLRTFWF